MILNVLNNFRNFFLFLSLFYPHLCGADDNRWLIGGGMDWQQAIREEEAMLRRVVALILSLADLADSACRRSRAVCGLLLWILSPVESAVRAFIGHSSDTPPEPSLSGDACENMRQLALRFRQFAEVLECQAELAFPWRSDTDSQSDRAPIGDRLLRLADAIKALAVAPLVHAPDTS